MLKFWVWGARSRIRELSEHFQSTADSIDSNIGRVSLEIPNYDLKQTLEQLELYAGLSAELRTLHSEFRRYHTTYDRDPNCMRAIGRLKCLRTLIKSSAEERGILEYQS